MKAVILTGGKGTRLLPLTHNMPKSIVPVLNIPFLEHVFRYLATHQIRDIILAQGYLSRPIQSYFGDGEQFGVRLKYITEATPLGTAGAVKNVEGYLDEPFLVLNGDIFTDLDITAMIDSHRRNRAKVTIALTPVADPTSYGLVLTNPDNGITSFLEKPTREQAQTNMINAGIYVLEPDVLGQIPAQTSFSFERELFPLLLSRGEPCYAFPAADYWIDMGTVEKYLQLHRDLLNGQSSQFTPPVPGEIVVGERSFIHPTARVEGRVIIGGGCTIGPNVVLKEAVVGSGTEILAGAVVEESVIWWDSVVGRRVELQGSIVADRCILHDGSVVRGCVLGGGVSIAGDCRLGVGSKIWPDKTAGIEEG